PLGRAFAAAACHPQLGAPRADRRRERASEHRCRVATSEHDRRPGPHSPSCPHAPAVDWPPIIGTHRPHHVRSLQKPRYPRLHVTHLPEAAVRFHIRHRNESSLPRWWCEPGRAAREKVSTGCGSVFTSREIVTPPFTSRHGRSRYARGDVSEELRTTRSKHG